MKTSLHFVVDERQKRTDAPMEFAGERKVN
jgi:hypothetical protein